MKQTLEGNTYFTIELVQSSGALIFGKFENERHALDTFHDRPFYGTSWGSWVLWLKQNGLEVFTGVDLPEECRIIWAYASSRVDSFAHGTFEEIRESDAHKDDDRIQLQLDYLHVIDIPDVEPDCISWRF